MKALAQRLGLLPEKADQKWTELSGGERQRIALALALALVQEPSRGKYDVSSKGIDYSGASELQHPEQTGSTGVLGSPSLPLEEGTDRILSSPTSPPTIINSVPSLGGTCGDGDSSSILILDEPTAACDKESTERVEEVLVNSGLTIIFVTHDEAQANRIAHKKLIFYTTM